MGFDYAQQERERKQYEFQTKHDQFLQKTAMENERDYRAGLSRERSGYGSQSLGIDIGVVKFWGAIILAFIVGYTILHVNALWLTLGFVIAAFFLGCAYLRLRPRRYRSVRRNPDFSIKWGILHVSLTMVTLLSMAWWWRQLHAPPPPRKKVDSIGKPEPPKKTVVKHRP